MIYPREKGDLDINTSKAIVTGASGIGPVANAFVDKLKMQGLLGLRHRSRRRLNRKPNIRTCLMDQSAAAFATVLPTTFIG